MTQAIQPYYGELLISPIPLEMSLIEPCDYGCAYCFAVLGDRHQAKKSGKSVHSNGTKAALSLISDLRNRKTLEATLLKMGYPVLMSNRTDPFGRVNRSATLPMLEVMAEMEIPVALQTKGFVNADDLTHVLEVIKPSCWYISIAFCDDDKRAKIEPGAPSIQHRLDLISTLVEAGHSVVIGVNPCVPEWFDDPLPMLQEFKKRGVWGVWVEALHLDHWQEKQLTPREKTNLTQDIIDRAKRKKALPDDPDVAHLDYVREMAQDVGLEVYSMGQHERSNFWDAYRRHYPRTFPTMQDFINQCHDAKLPTGSLINYWDFASQMLPYLPEGILQVGHYIGSTAHQVCRDHPNWKNKFTYDELLNMLWNDPRIKMSPSMALPISYVFEDDYRPVVDECGDYWCTWNPCGQQEMFVDIKETEGAQWLARAEKKTKGSTGAPLAGSFPLAYKIGLLEPEKLLGVRSYA